MPRKRRGDASPPPRPVRRAFGPIPPMLTYVYESLPRPGKAPKRFEIRQSIKAAPLTRHPETGEPIRRIIVVGADPFVRAATIERPDPPPPRKSRHKASDHHHDG